MEDWHQKIGHLLALERQRRDIEIDEVAADLKITAEHLGSIEAGNPGGLPSPLYFDLFAKSYAEYLGIDYAATVQAIKEQLEEIEQPPLDKKRARTDKGKSAQVGSGKSPGDSGEEDEEGQRDRSAAFRKLAWILGGAIVLLLVFLVVNALWLDPGDSGQSALQRTADTESVVESPDQKTLEEAALIEWREPPEGPPPPIVVRLQARQRSWTEILTDGDTAWQGNLNAGSWVEETARYRSEISVGVPAQVDVTINGDTVNLRNAKERIYREDVNQLNLAEVLAGKRPFETSNIEITTAEDLGAAQQASTPTARREPSARQLDQPEGQSSTTAANEADEPPGTSATPDQREQDSPATNPDTSNQSPPAGTAGTGASPAADTTGLEED